MSIIFIIITIIYVFLIGYIIYGFEKVEIFNSKNEKPTTKFSIIVPFKNEVNNLPSLLESVLNLNYPNDLYELILVDDQSSDGSAETIKKTIDKRFLEGSRSDISILNNNRKTASPKKYAINTAINQAKYDWIITTDADCLVPINWLKTYDAFIKTHPTNFIAGPVSYSNTNTFFKRFQALDFYSLIGSTIGGFGIQKPFMCNGANLAYKKSFFKTINGFEGNTNIASGDDIFLLEKAVKYDSKTVHYLKSYEAIVSTKPQSNFNLLFNQRLRWAAKTSSYNNWFGKLTGLIVLLMNSSIILGLLFVILGFLNVNILISIFALKFIIDLFILIKTSHFLNHKNVLSAYFTSSVIYPFFSTTVAILAIFYGYNWKDQYYKK